MLPIVLLNALAISSRSVGGDITYVRSLVDHIGAAGADLHVKVLVQNGTALSKRERAPELLSVRLPLASASATVRVLYEQVVVPYVAARANAALLHAPVNVAPFRLPCRMVLTVHECEPFKDGYGIPPHIRAWWLFSRRTSVRNADLILAPSARAAKDLTKYMGVEEGRVLVTPLGVDHSQFWPDGAGASRWRGQLGDYFLWVGVPYPRKNLGTLLKAFAALRMREVKLVLVGPAGWGSRLVREWISKLKIYDRVTVMDALPPSELRGLYSGAVAFVFPSLEETFGLPVLEAMACGSPVIASNIEVFHEVAGDAAIMVDPVSPDALREAMEQVIEDAELRRRMASHGLERAASFTWSRTAELTADAYRRVLKCT